MPYSRTSELPSRVKDAIPSSDGKKLFMEVVNSQLAEGRSESVSFASAWAALSNAGYSQNDDGKWTKMAKRQINDDAFTYPDEARARSFDLGFEGAIHVHDLGGEMRVYMPGPDHETYLQGVQDELPLNDRVDNDEKGLFERAISAILQTVMPTTEVQTRITKVDEERRIVYGWASVSTEKGRPVIDKQGDYIPPDEMEKMATKYMLSEREGKVMHSGDRTSITVHSMPMTKEIAKSFGIKTDREGWMIAQKFYSDEAWEGFKSGKYKAFSIGGHGMREDYEASD